MYYNEFIPEEIKNNIYPYITHIKEFENFEAKIDASSYLLRSYAEKSKYIFSIDYEFQSKMISVDGRVIVDDEEYIIQYTSSLDRTVKSDSFRFEDDKVIRKSYNRSSKITDEKEFDKNLFVSVKKYKKD